MVKQEMTNPMTKRPEPNRRQVLGAGLALGAAGVLGLSGCASREAAPDSTFVLLDGSQARTADLQGKVTLVNFWATTCVTCVKEMPALVATHQKYAPRGYETMAVAMSYDPPAWVVNFVQSRQLPFKVALDNTGEIAKAWGDVKLTPTTYLLDKQGRIVKRYVGEPEMDALHKLIEELLAA
ncbi:TlpA family protein disulfide reductase [Hydrogenophaga borbori]|uniref:TlpA family protein disulfide reductase n=2 Tax=Hydrogenophaga borbori TaxID=2294117 RepID=A0A372EDX9_9BURK|nr:TlpA family protein disulfide reductase [Hydrogenophaga borbori]